RDKALARMGSWVVYDGWGYLDAWYFGHYALADEIRADLVKAMIDAGFANRLLQATGANLFSLGWQRSNPYVGKHTAEHVLRFAPGHLRRVGISEDVFWKIMTENPKQVIPIQ
ncbi:hypothetical protein ACFLYR_08010, partial [Chloroflexota bacterium]